MSPVRGLPATWRERAAQIRRYAPEAAAAFEDAASDLERELREADNDVLTLHEAQRESGYSADHLGRLLKAGAIPNVGRKHAPRIRRADLPRKADAPKAGRVRKAPTTFEAIRREALASIPSA